jgi:tripartite-type tricarboxylate transporter receptor subunit TctC
MAGTVSGQDAFPSKAITIINPNAPGGFVDNVGRGLALAMQKFLKQPVLIVNRPGANGSIGTVAVANAAPDGYTILMGTISTHTLNPIMGKTKPYDPVKDFAPISLLVNVPNVLVVHASLGVNNVQELVALLKKEPGKHSYASSGNGSAQHLMGGMFEAMAGVQMKHVPYRSSAGAANDLVAGVVDVSFAGVPNALAQVPAGRLKALAVTTPTRSSTLPDVPTFAELGFPTVNITSWYGVAGPANLPADITDKISRTFAQAAKSGPLHDKLVSSGIDPILSTPAEMSRTLRTEREQLQAIVKSIGFKKD